MKRCFFVISLLLSTLQTLEARPNQAMCGPDEARDKHSCPTQKSSGGTGECKKHDYAEPQHYTIDVCKCYTEPTHTNPTKDCKQPGGVATPQCTYPPKPVGAVASSKSVKYYDEESCTKAATEYCNHACKFYASVKSVPDVYYCCKSISPTQPADPSK